MDKRFGTTLLLSALLPAFMLANTFAQERVQIPHAFTRISASAGTLPAKFAEAARQFRNKADGDRYWIGYQFEFHEGIDFSEHRIYLHDNGGVSFYKGDSHWFWEDEESEDLEMSVHRALAELGEEASKKILEERKTTYARDENDYAVYFLIEPQTGQVERIQFLDFEHLNRLRDLPVYWLGKVGTEQSFEYIRTIADDAGYANRLRKPALFLASLHESPQVIPYLVQVSGNNDERELQKKAVFWLGQIPKEESFVELSRLFERAKDRKLKEEIIFSISQHRSEKAPAFLIDIAESQDNRDVRKKAIFWLGQIAGKRALQTIRGIIDDDSDAEVQAHAVFALTQHGDKEEVARMLIDIAKNHRSPKVRKKAIFWLSQTNEAQALAFFKEILAK